MMRRIITCFISFLLVFSLSACSSDSSSGTVTKESVKQPESISATYEGITEDGTVISKDDFTVVATYEDGTTEEISDFKIDNVTLVENETATITVTAGDVSTTVDITGTAPVSQEYKNALSKAESYANMMYMSKQGIYDQLVSEYGERFTAEEAQYAVDNLNADWNANALEKAKSYYTEMAMSKDAVYQQLVSEYGEKFTAEEAQYAVDNLE